jgi:hypothetical protein
MSWLVIIAGLHDQCEAQQVMAADQVLGTYRPRSVASAPGKGDGRWPIGDGSRDDTPHRIDLPM